jgi:hypothetical protein
MIRFERTCTLSEFSWDTAAVLINASMWSHKTHHTVIVHALYEEPFEGHPCEAPRLAANLSTDPVRDALVEDLTTYLAQTMPTHYKIRNEGAYVRVERGLLVRDARRARR